MPPETPQAVRPTSKKKVELPKLIATVQIMKFAPGVYAFDLAPQPIIVGQEGLAAPCIRLDSLGRGRQGGGAAFVSMLADSEFVIPGGPSAFVRVTGADNVSILMTVYRLENTPPPEVRVRAMGHETALPIRTEAAAAPALRDSAPQGTDATLAGAALLVHLEGKGDMRVPLGQWAGEPGSGRSIEGFALDTAGLFAIDQVEYQGALGREWDTPWFQPDEFCGSRGMALPLIGVRVRTLGETAETTVCRVWASFMGHGERGPFTQGELCGWEEAPIEALKVEFGAPDERKPAAGGRRRLGR